MLIKERFPEKLVAKLGVKPTVNAEDPPGGIVSGSASPVLKKPAPLKEA